MRVMCQGCQSLETAGVDFIVIPCNSAHNYICQMRESVENDVLLIIEETTKEIVEQGLSKVLLLATEYSIKKQLYAQLNDFDVEAVIPDKDQQNMVMEAMKNVFARKMLSQDHKNLAEVIHTHKYENVIQEVALGCTELPLVLVGDSVDDVVLFDTLKSLAESSFKRSAGLS